MTIILIILSLAMISVLVGGGWAAIFLRGRLRRLNQNVRNLTGEEMSDFIDGNSIYNPNDVHAPIYALTYNNKFEVPRHHIQIDESQVLGSGQFGIVRRGVLLMATSSQGRKNEKVNYKKIVAVKTCRVDVDAETFKTLLSEIKILSYLEPHDNIAGLLGACTMSIRKRQVWALVEFCGKGDLLNFLRKEKPQFETQIQKVAGKNLNLNSVSNKDYSQSTLNSSPLTPSDLLRLSQDIANGMAYLTERNVVHGDVAARNILLTDHLKAKISDFGLARQLLLNNSIYVKTHKTLLPWMWLSYESLNLMIFSVKSDVWSYGVLLYEIFSMGQEPYPYSIFGAEFLQDLANGVRMSKPEFASDEIYAVMLECWKKDPNERPSFEEIMEKFQEIMSSFPPLITNKDKSAPYGISPMV